MQMFPFVNVSTWFSTSMINLAIRHDSNAIQQWIKWSVEPVVRVQVIWSHRRPQKRLLYINNSSQKRDRAVGEVSSCLSSQDAPTDMQYDLLGSFISSCRLTWPKIKFSNLLYVVEIHMLRCFGTRGIRRYFAFFSMFVSSKVIC